MLVETIVDLTPREEDQEAVWKIGNKVQFRARPLPEELLELFDDSKVIVPPRELSNRSVGIYELGHGVLLKAKRLGMGGSAAEPAAMQLIRKEAPSVPVPEVFHHWRDEVWFCHFTLMRQVPGMDIGSVWFALAPEHQQRLAEEVAVHMHTVAQITTETSQRADGTPEYDQRVMSDPVMWEEPREFIEPPYIDYHLTAKQIYDGLEARGDTYYTLEEMGDRFHLCHMDASPHHFFIADNTGSAKYEWMTAETIPLEEQESMHVSGIIDWERSGFFLRYAVAWQFPHAPMPLPYYLVKKPMRAGDEFSDAVTEALVKLGWPDPESLPDEFL